MNMIDGSVLPVRGMYLPQQWLQSKLIKLCNPCVGIADRRSVVPHIPIPSSKNNVGRYVMLENKEVKLAQYEEVTQQIMNKN